jgi:uncharacterized protein
MRVLAREQGRAVEMGLPVQPLIRGSAAACMAIRQSSMAIGPDGLLYKCPEDIGVLDRAYGSIFDDEIRLSNLLPWMVYDGLRYKECLRCTVLPQCGGGCAHKRLFPTKDLNREGFCAWAIRADLRNHIRQYAMHEGAARVVNCQ